MNNLRELRKDRGWTQQELAERAGLSNVTISALELGNKSPRAEVRRKIEKALKSRVDWLSTIGIDTRKNGEMVAWEAIEQRFREALGEIRGLSAGEQKEFIQVGHHYLDMLEARLTYEEKLKQIKSKSYELQ